MPKPKPLTYKQAYILCLDIAADHAEKADKDNSYLRFHEAYEIYQEMGALMLRLPREGKK